MHNRNIVSCNVSPPFLLNGYFLFEFSGAEPKQRLASHFKEFEKRMRRKWINHLEAKALEEGTALGTSGTAAAVAGAAIDAAGIEVKVDLEVLTSIARRGAAKQDAENDKGARNQLLLTYYLTTNQRRG